MFKVFLTPNKLKNLLFCFHVQLEVCPALLCEDSQKAVRAVAWASRRHC